VVYPHLIGGMATLETLGKMNKIGFFRAIFKATGVSSMVFNDVDEPELLDDLRDHWSSVGHFLYLICVSTFVFCVVLRSVFLFRLRGKRVPPQSPC